MSFLNNFFKKIDKDKISKINSSAEIFNNIDDIEDVIDRKFSVINQNTNGTLSDPFTAAYNNLSFVPILTNKSDRIRQYRTMSRYHEVDFCIDEIADDFAHTDETGEMIKLKIESGSKISTNENKKNILNEEFKKYISLFNLKENIYTLVKKYVVEGEIAYENIIDPKNPLKGIIGVKYLPTEYYETLIDPKNGKPLGIYFDIESLKLNLQQLVSGGYSTSSSTFERYINSSYSSYMHGGKIIPLMWPQLTYISSNDTTPDENIHFPIIDKVKQPYYQLSLMHDAAIILRVTRAPERLLFNISTGGMPDKVAKTHVRKFVEDFKSKKIPNNNKEISKIYNPQTMLEAYFFWKNANSDGTSVESVGGTAKYDEMEDVEYFLRRLFKQFKVPFTRYKTPENTMERDETITYEEYSFAKQLIRIHSRFAKGFKHGYIIHLKLRGLWDKYKLEDKDISIDFVPPVLYELYQSQKLMSIRMESYDLIADKEEFSKRIAMKKVLGMNDEEIDQNFEEVIKEKCNEGVIDFYKEKLTELGPEKIKSPIKWKQEIVEDN